MGFVYVIAPCFGCKLPFSFNPHVVPSIRFNGHLEPVCASCVDRANPRRIANGLPPIVVLPGAYEALEESEL